MGSLILLAFVGVFIFAIYRSKKRIKTALYGLVAILIGFVCFGVAGYFSKLTGEVVGELGLYVGMLCGMLAMLIHSRLSRKSEYQEPTDRVEEKDSI